MARGQKRPLCQKGMPVTTRIGYDATPMLGSRSGIGHYAARLLAGLIAVNPAWEFLLLSKQPLPPLEPELQRAIPLPGHLARSHWLWLQLVSPWIIRRQQPNLCHFTNELAPLWPIRPYVLTLHDASLFLFSQYHPRLRLWTRLKLLPISARKAAAIITVSENSRQDLMRVLKLPADKIHVVSEAAPAHFQPVREAGYLSSLQQQYGLPERFILYVGALEPRKNLYRLIGALAQLRQAGHRHHLVMAGPAGWLMDDFDKRVAELGLEDAVHHLGYVPTADLPGLFSLAEVFAFPSLYEGFGLPVLEAMACGTPVLTTHNGALAELAHGAAELVDPEDEDSIAAGLRHLVEDADWRRELSRCGRERAAQYTWQRAAQETTAVYQKVLWQQS